MKAPVRFAKSRDGTTIAAWQLGSGPPLVVATMAGGLWPPSITMDEQNPTLPLFYNSLARNHTVILYDPRGYGLSQRDVTDYSLEAATDDLLAVADLYELHEFALLGFRGPARAAIQFAATYPARLSRMIIRDPVLAVRDHVLRPRERHLQSMIEIDFDFYIDALSLSMAGWEMGRNLAEGARGAITREAFLAAQTSRAADGWGFVPRVACPTLVIHSRTSEDVYPIDVARRVAAGIPLATFSVMEGGATPYDPRDAEEFASVVLSFLDPAPPGNLGRTPVAGTSVILFADIADSTGLTERLGDATFRQHARALDDALRSAITSNGGTPIDGKLLGDGVLATFPAASQAIAGALACERACESTPLTLHVGLHAGDVIHEQGNVYGGAVNIASRVCGLSAPGEILVSATVRELARTSAGVEFEDRGEHILKGVLEPQRLYRVAPRERT